MPNELYIKWLKEWTDKAYEIQSKGYQTLRRALESMKACPIEIGHPSQAAQLKFIGPGLCAKLEKTLIAHCQQNDLPMPEKPREKRSGPEAGADQELPAAKKRTTKPYVPAYRNGAYALLMGMTEPSARDSMPKSDLIRLSQSFCDSSFEIASDTRGFYTAWNSMKTLLEKELVHKAGNPPKYSITDAGVEVATRIRATPDPARLVQNLQSGRGTLLNLDRNVSATQLSADEELSAPRPLIVDVEAPFVPTIIPAGSFKVQLVIDNREVKTQKDRAFIEDQLYRAGIELTARTLEVGDALWIAKCEDGREVVLDHIVERKRMDDLVSSIKDGRYQEQKFRLHRCGARNVIFIIEETNAQEVASYQEAIQTALSSTQVVSGFFVKRVQSLDYTIRYLIKLTKKLSTFYEVSPSPPSNQ